MKKIITANKKAYAFFLKNIKKLNLTNSEKILFLKGSQLYYDYWKFFHNKR